MNKLCFTSGVLILAFLIISPVQAKSLRVDADWLNSNLNDPDLVILDVRSDKDYEIEHISGALNMPNELTYQQKSEGGKIVEPDIMQKELRKRGIDDSKKIIVYDNGDIFDSARVFWALEVYGLHHVKILNGGYRAWTNKNYPVGSVTPAVTPSQYVPTINHQRIASKFTTQLATVTPNKFVVDARPVTAYEGKTSTAKRFGHIPSSLNIPVTHNLTKKDGLTELLEPEQLQELYADLPKENKIILYCEIGRVSSTNYLVLRELGYDVSNYDASWREWGNDFSLPIEK